MFVIIWEFLVRRDRAEEFEAVYGPQGEWAQLFMRSDDYHGTDLHRDLTRPTRYISVDRWSDAAAFDRFRQQNSSDYAALDRSCQTLTERETQLGNFESLE